MREDRHHDGPRRDDRRSDRIASTATVATGRKLWCEPWRCSYLPCCSSPQKGSGRSRTRHRCSAQRAAARVRFEKVPTANTACAGFPMVAWWTNGRIFTRCAAAHAKFRYWSGMSAIGTESTWWPCWSTTVTNHPCQISARHYLAVSEFVRQHHRLLRRRGVARQVHPFWIVQTFSPVGDVEIVPR